MTSSRGGLVLVVVAASVLGGCSDSGAVRLPEWTLVDKNGEENYINLPAHVNDLIERDRDYVLVTELPLSEELRGKKLELVVPWIAANTTARVSSHPLPKSGEFF